MTDVRDLTEAEYRLARHYLNKLRAVDEAMRRGRVTVAYGLAVFDQEWEQIRRWQAWTTQRAPEDRQRAQLCKEFPLAGLEVLANRNNVSDHAAWLRAALEAAQQLQDQEAERTLSYELMMTYYRLGKLDMIQHYASELLKLGEAAHDLLAMERAYFGLGAYSEERGKYAEAEYHLQRALRLALKLGIAVETGRVLNALGSVAGYLGEFQKSYQYFLQYLELMETHGQKSKVCHALVSIGEVFICLKAYAEAERYLQRAVSMCRALGFQRFLGIGLLNLGTLAIEQGELGKARQYLLEGTQAVRALGVQRQIIVGLTALGYVDLRLGDIAGAFGSLREGLALAREAGRPRMIGEVQLNLASASLAVNDLNAARSALQESLTSAQSLGARPQQVRTLSGVVAYCQRLGLHQQAATWAGALLGDPLVDEALFNPVCAQLETALGSDEYQQALAQGKAQPLEAVVAEALALLA